MKFYDKTKNFFKGLQQRFYLGSSLVVGSEVPEPSQYDYLASFQASSLVHTATSKIAERVAMAELELYQLRGGTSKIVEQHDLLDLLARPNPIMSGNDLLRITVVFETLVGNAYWYIARNGAGKPIELWPMRPDYVHVIANPDGSIKEYRFRNQIAQQMIIKPEDVVQFKDPNPLSDYYGVGAIAPVMEVIRGDVFAKKWNTRFFYNSARPDAILTTQKDMKAAERDEIRDKWIEKYGSWNRAYSVAVLSSGLDYKQVSLTQKDMDFANMRIANREDVLMALQVPKSILGLSEDINRASAETAKYVFLSETIVPKIEKLLDKLNHSLVPNFGDDLLLTFIDPTPQNQETMDAHYNTLVGKILTVNEARIEMGYMPVEGGDGLYQALNLVEIGKASSEKHFEAKETERKKKLYLKGARGNKILKLQEDIIAKVHKRAAEKIAAAFVEKETKTPVEKIAEAIVKSESETEADAKKKEFRDAHWKMHDARLTKWEGKFKTTVENLMLDQAKRAVEKLNESKSVKSVRKSIDINLLDKEKECIIFAKATRGLFTEIVKDAGEAALAQVIGEKSVSKAVDFDPADPVTAEWIKKKTTKFAEEVNATTIAKLQDSLSEGVLEGESIPELKKRVVEVFKGRIASSAATIARTEVLSSNNAGTIFGYEQSGVVSKKEWLAAIDGKTREDHASADGQEVGMDESFDIGGESLEYPGDPSGSPENIINCRCTVIPIVDTNIGN